jgi:hypothetical protein
MLESRIVAGGLGELNAFAVERKDMAERAIIELQKVSGPKT